MRWKLIGLFVLTAALVFAVFPIRTHAVVHDPMYDQALARGSIGDMLANMYLTPGTVLPIVGILAVASFVASKVLRGHW